ncbi:2Fe-2S iron-sulfur cluster binding domain-containing protein, partial [Pandoraea nosoerga]|nr:2Fe-2S iron-sulfur cluster binding domain-containing protein [Pandoraea nosoerga]
MTTPTSTPITLHVNGKVVDVNVSPEMPLLYALRNDLSLKGPRFGCGLGQCGACSVLIDGVVQRSCVLPVGAAAGRPITTLEGMGTPEKPDPLQQA